MQVPSGLHVTGVVIGAGALYRVAVRPVQKEPAR